MYKGRWNQQTRETSANSKKIVFTRSKRTTPYVNRLQVRCCGDGQFPQTLRIRTTCWFGSFRRHRWLWALQDEIQPGSGLTSCHPLSSPAPTRATWSWTHPRWTSWRFRLRRLRKAALFYARGRGMELMIHHGCKHLQNRVQIEDLPWSKVGTGTRFLLERTKVTETIGSQILTRALLIQMLDLLDIWPRERRAPELPTDAVGTKVA